MEERIRENVHVRMLHVYASIDTKSASGFRVDSRDVSRSYERG